MTGTVRGGVAARAGFAEWGLLAAVVVAGLFARLVALDAWGLWADEGWSMFFAQHGGWSDFVQENHPPLYYLMLRGFLQVVSSDVGLRATSTIASLGSMFVTYRLARAMQVSAGSAILAVAAVAVASGDVEAARQIRMYAWMVVAFGLALAAAWRWHRSGRPLDLLWVLLASLAVCYLHGSGIFYAGAICLFLLILAPTHRARAQVVGLGVAILLLYAPWVVSSTLQRLKLMTPDSGLVWRHPSTLGTMVSAPLRLFVDGAPLGPNWAGVDTCRYAAAPGLCESLGLGVWRLHGYLPLGAFLAALAAVALAAGRRAVGAPGRLVIALVAMCAMPYLSFVAIERFVAPWFDVKYLVPLVVPMAILFGMWVDRAAARAPVARGLAWVAVGVIALTVVAYPQSKPFQEYREAVQALLREHRDGEVVFVNGEGQGHVTLVERYLPDPSRFHTLVPLRYYVYDNYTSDCPPSPGVCLDRLKLPPDAPSRAWMVQGPNPLDNPQRRHGAELSAWLRAHFEVVKVHDLMAVQLIELRRR